MTLVLSSVSGGVDALILIRVLSSQKNLYEPLLKTDLECWRCHKKFKTMPALKKHLTQEKEAEASDKKKALQEKEGQARDTDD